MVRLIRFGCLFVTLAVLGAGCASTSSTRAEALAPTTRSETDLTAYTRATVAPFAIAPDADIDASIGARFAQDIATRLRHDFGPLFTEVRSAPVLGQADELIVTGTIKTYREGNRFLRGMLIGLGSAAFEGEVILKSGQGERVLFAAAFDKLWAWGGFLGMSKGIEEMWAEAAASVANTIARAKGWTPSSAATTAGPNTMGSR